MKKTSNTLGLIILSVAVLGLLFSFKPEEQAANAKFPYKKFGLTKEQAAAHLLSRFTYGPKSGEVQQISETGLEKWFEQQLRGNMPEDSLPGFLSGYDALKLSNSEVNNLFPANAKVFRQAIREGYIKKDSSQAARDYKAEIAEYMKTKGYRPFGELNRQFISQKILRATYANNQLHELLTDFWFNHFNVSMTKESSRPYIPAYERDVIRPNVTGKFGTLLIATAQSPAMLNYLDNASSIAPDSMTRAGIAKRQKQKPGNAKPKKPSTKGINENYAREVMELHTMGVDGGYSQSDVTETARVLTGWTVSPLINGDSTSALSKLVLKLDTNKTEAADYIHNGDFVFIPARHDAGEKTVLGKKFAQENGYREGVDLLQMLARHRATAKFISRKLAIRFVSDSPPQSLVDKMTKTYLSTDGDIAAVLRTMAYSDEFWNKNVLREKTKTPFELAVSTVRGLNATLKQPYQIYVWTNRMGQNLYNYQAPTGFPDRASYWINTGSLLNRMNFGLAAAAGRIQGVEINLKVMNELREPESAQKALVTYGTMLMPGRDLKTTFERLSPLLVDPELATKVNAAAARQDTTRKTALAITKEQNTMLAQVVGVLIGSPEFQRR